MKYIDKIANIAIILAVAVFLGIVVHNQFFKPKVTSPIEQTAKVGSTITVPGIHLPAQEDSLVLGISTTCHFCQASLPFYKKLTSELQGKVNVIAVLPQSQSEAEKFVQTAGLSGTRVVSANLTKVGVYATPTLLLLDSHGKVKSRWIGELTPARQKQIVAALLPKGSPTTPHS